jgi:hypothetical protein
LVFTVNAVDPRFAFANCDAGTSSSSGNLDYIRVRAVLPIHACSKATIFLWVFSILRIFDYFKKLWPWRAADFYIL